MLTRRRLWKLGRVVGGAAAVTAASAVLLCAALAVFDGLEGWGGRMRFLLGSLMSLSFDIPGDLEIARAGGQAIIRPVPLDVRLRLGGFWSAGLVGGTLLGLVGLGVPLGVVGATRPESRALRAVRNALVACSTLPVVIWATILWFWLGPGLHWIPLRGTSELAAGDAISLVVAGVASLLLGDRLLADVVSRARVSADLILSESYMRTVRAADLGYRRHLVRSLVPPMAELLHSRAMYLIGSAIVVEWVFGIPGLGYLLLNALNGLADPGMIMACTMLLVLIGVVLRVAKELAIGLADPRESTS